MTNFKAGNTVVCVNTDGNSYITVGKEYNISDVKQHNNTVLIYADHQDWWWYSASLFELAKPKYDLNTQPWFIKINGDNEFAAAKEWLVLNGFKGSLHASFWSTDREIGNVGNVNDDGSFDINNQLYTVTDYFSHNNVPEIKLNFKTVIDSAVFPELKSAKDLEIERIQNEMQKLQADLEKLKGE